MTEGAVKLHVLKGPRVPETAGHPFLCEHFRGTLTGSECLRRQTQRMKAPPIAINKAPRVPQHLEYCASGKCDQGAEVAKKFPDWKPEDRPPPDWQAQWTAKRRHDAVDAPLLGPASPEEKPMAEAKTEATPPRTCSESGCPKMLRSDNTTGLCTKHANVLHQRNYQARKTGKPDVPNLADLRGDTAIRGRKKEMPGIKSSREQLTGQDEFDLMIAIRDQFRKLSADGQRYVLAALKGAA